MFHVKLFAPDTGGGSPAVPPAQGGGAGEGHPGGEGAPPPPASFAETLPAEIRGEAAFRDIKDLGGLAKSYLNATKMIGGRPEDLVRIPGPDDAAGWQTAYGKLGRPETADKYTLTPAAGQQFGDADRAFHAAMLPAVHEAGLSQKQLDRVIGAWNDYAGKVVGEQDQAVQAAREQAVAALRGEWGAAYDQKLGQARQALAHYGDDGLRSYLEESRLGDHPGMLKLFARLGAQLAEDGVVGRAGGGAGGGALSPAEAQQQVNAKYQDAQFMKAYRDRSAPGHADAVAAMARLFEQAYPQAA